VHLGAGAPDVCVGGSRRKTRTGPDARTALVGVNLDDLKTGHRVFKRFVHDELGVSADAGAA